MRHPGSVSALGWEPFLASASTLVSVEILGRYPVRIQSILEDGLVAVESVLDASGYENPCDWIGSYYVRPIAGTDVWSTHSYGIAIDLDYGGGDDEPAIDHNPHIHRRIYPADVGFGIEWQILEEQVRRIEAIRSTGGRQYWRWLGWPIGDTMHLQGNTTPEDTEVDPDSVYQGEEPMSFSYEEETQGWVRGLAEDAAKARREFERLNQPRWLGPDGEPVAILEPANSTATVDYWVGLLGYPDHSDWPGFRARTELSVWGR